MDVRGYVSSFKQNFSPAMSKYTKYTMQKINYLGYD